MKRTLLALLASAALTSALPLDAVAGGEGGNDGSYRQQRDGTWDRGRRDGRWNRNRGGCDSGAYSQIQGELQSLYERVRRGQYDGSYSRDSAKNFYRAIQLDQQYLDYYSNDGCLDRRELNDLRYRIDALREQMRQYDRRGRRGGRW